MEAFARLAQGAGLGGGHVPGRLVPLLLQEGQGLPGEGLDRLPIGGADPVGSGGGGGLRPAQGRSGVGCGQGWGREGLALLPQGLELPGELGGLPGQGPGGLPPLGSGARGEGGGDADVLGEMLVELLVEGAQDGHGGTGGLGGGRLVPAGTVPDLLEPEDPFHDALGGPALLGRGPFTAQNLQHQLEVHLERDPGGPGGGSGGFLALLQQVQRHKRPASLLLLGPGQQVLREGLGQGAEGGEGQPLPGEHAHIRFCHRDRVHQ